MSQYEKEESSDRYSLRGKVFHQLREDILSGHYKEHEELREMAISEEMGVSRTPVPGSAAPTGTGRPGQHYPEQGGICDRHHQKGRGGYLCDPFFAGRALCRWATAYITEKQLDALEENIYLSEFHASKGHAQKLTELDDQFHDILYEACSSKMLEHQLRDFHEYVRRMRKQNLSGSERGLEAVLEHKQIMEAICRKDADRAQELAALHMRNAYDNMIKNGLLDAYDEKERIDG